MSEHRGVGLLSLMIVVATTLIPLACRGQADPAWLRSWNEAQERRPTTLAPSGRIASENEPGQPMIVRGLIVEPDGAPASGVVVHAYHRDRDGFDFGPDDSSLTTWRLQGWVQTDAEGRFELHTIRPAPDHLGREGSHIHFTLESEDFGRQWAPTVYFSDDPMVTEAERRRSRQAGEFGWVREVETFDGVEMVSLKFRLKGKADF